jgi:AcrR family transcriptional regulator
MAQEPPREPPNTRARILDTCLSLFNESGPSAVTTAEIARAVGINEGNLYYYFKKKEDILVALFEQYEAALDRVSKPPRIAPGDVNPGLDYLKNWFILMWEWRFFYRDVAMIKRMAPKLMARVPALAERGQGEVRKMLADMVEKGLLIASPEELDRLVVNAWIVSSYWLDYLHSRHNVENVTREHLDWGFAQVRSLFTPYATPEIGHTGWSMWEQNSTNDT